MDTSEWSSNIAVRNKEPVVTVREILQDSDVDDQIIEPCSSHSPRKRNHCEVEKNSIINPSIREIAASKKGNERFTETPNIRKQLEGLIVTLSGSAAPSAGNRPEPSGTNETTSIKAKMIPIDTLSPALAHLSSAHHENPRSSSISSSSESLHYKYHNLKRNYENIPHNISEAQPPKKRSDKYETELNNIEPNQNCEHTSNTFEYLFPTIKDRIEQQRSQFDTVTERINEIFNLIQQGERLLQNAMTTENASQSELLVDRITHVLAEDLRIDDSTSAIPNFSPERGFVAQVTNVHVSTDPSQTLKELWKFARSNMGVILSEKEEVFIESIKSLNATQTRLKEEWNMLNSKEDKNNFKFMLEMNSSERAKVLQRAWDLKKEIANFYMCAETRK
ncbi:uncharacterized protein EAE97_000982 [Botrytis byssoidea]|uniref:Uncharacterized protein n=1 Tax=Botrytis byssoidea TaxID=139641 RepID=A0A9P5IZ98_9HELO|nr:uncharacterized protein EAE97_000982 [Botrytis byssoidea]KAF7953583.1 hypothetical protein EAE97_000982 [Botrytis byssoidea]